MDFVKLHVQHENMKALCATSSKHAHGHKQQAMLNIVHLGRHQWHLVFGWSAGPWNENPGRSFFLCINERARGGRSFYQLQLILNLDLCWMAGIKIALACAKSHNGVHNHLDFKVVFHSGNLPFIGIGFCWQEQNPCCGWRHHWATWLKLQSKPGPLEFAAGKLQHKENHEILNWEHASSTTAPLLPNGLNAASCTSHGPSVPPADWGWIQSSSWSGWQPSGWSCAFFQGSNNWAENPMIANG